jgi:hypothetical protein
VLLHGIKLRPHSSTITVNWVQSATITLKTDGTKLNAGYPVHLTVSVDGQADPRSAKIIVFGSKPGTTTLEPVLECDLKGACVNATGHRQRHFHHLLSGRLLCHGGAAATACTKTYTASAVDGSGTRLKDSNKVSATW